VLDHILDRLADEGVLLEPRTARFVLTLPDPVSYVRAAVREMEARGIPLPLVLTIDDLILWNDRRRHR